MSIPLPAERADRIYLARLYCEQARLALAAVSRGLPHHLLDMAILELRSEEARLKAGEGLMEPLPRRRQEQQHEALENVGAACGCEDPAHLG